LLDGVGTDQIAGRNLVADRMGGDAGLGGLAQSRRKLLNRFG
jgi:hypothetical protein